MSGDFNELRGQLDPGFVKWLKLMEISIPEGDELTQTWIDQYRRQYDNHMRELGGQMALPAGGSS